MLLQRSKSQLLVIDIQEKMVKAVQEAPKMLKNCEILLKAANELSIPITCSEQYPKGLGYTMPALKELLPTPALEKSTMSCAKDSALKSALAKGAVDDRKMVVIMGIEAHICVLESAIDLAELDYDVFVVWDAVSSRAPVSLEITKSRLEHHGIQLITTEMVLFEWLERCDDPAFKKLTPLIK